MILHTQIMPWFKEDFKFDLFLKSNAEFFNEAVENSGFKGCVVLENVCEKDSSLTAKLIEAVALPQVKLNLDWGHALISGEKIKITEITIKTQTIKTSMCLTLER